MSLDSLDKTCKAGPGLHGAIRLQKSLGAAWSCGKLETFGGAVAQLGARLDGIEEVVGSNPIGSTI
jgi:hypothetical protein